LYELGRDPGEQLDLAAEEPIRLAGVLERMEAWLAGLQPSEHRPEEERGNAEDHERTLERQRALGYAQ
jgi:predicted neuraminidase